MTTQSVMYFIPWEVWEWIKLAMDDEQARPVSGFNDPESDDSALAHAQFGSILTDKVRAQADEGRHEGVQERDALRDGAVQERRGPESVRAGGDIFGIDKAISDMYSMREHGAYASEGRGRHTPSNDCPHYCLSCEYDTT